MRRIPWQNHIMTIFFYFSNLVWLNILWIIFSILGAILFGLAPATLTVSDVLREMNNESDFISINQFWHQYRRNFKKANTILLPLFVLTCVPMLSYRIVVVEMGGNIFFRAFLLACFFVMLLVSIASIQTIHLLPKSSFFNYFKLDLTFVLIYPLHSVVALLSLIGCSYVLSRKLIFVILAGTSLPLWILILQYRRIILRFIDKYQLFNVSIKK